PPKLDLYHHVPSNACYFFCFVPLLVFFFNATPTPAISTLSLHDALPISSRWRCSASWASTATENAFASCIWAPIRGAFAREWRRDRKSTRLNSSHVSISYAVFCLKKKKDVNVRFGVPIFLECKYF